MSKIKAYITGHKKLAAGFIIGGATGCGLFKLVTLINLAFLPSLVAVALLLMLAFNIIVWQGIKDKRNEQKIS